MSNYLDQRCRDEDEASRLVDRFLNYEYISYDEHETFEESVWLAARNRLKRQDLEIEDEGSGYFVRVPKIELVDEADEDSAWFVYSRSSGVALRYFVDEAQANTWIKLQNTSLPPNLGTEGTDLKVGNSGDIVVRTPPSMSVKSGGGTYTAVKPKRSEAEIAYPLILDEQRTAQVGDGFDPWWYSTDLPNSTDDCVRFADGIECIMWRDGRWQLEPDEVAKSEED
jgi:hypothetical protein